MRLFSLHRVAIYPADILLPRVKDWWRRWARTLAGVRQRLQPTGQSATELVEHHLSLDRAFDEHLREVIGETESAAMSLIVQVRKLSDEARTLVDYLGNSTLKTGSFDQMILNSVDNINRIGQFVSELPEQKRREMAAISAVVEKIGHFGDLTQSIKDISKKTDIVAINASIEAQHAGKAGGAFKVLASEIRQLAERSGAAATLIEQGLAETQRSVQESLRGFMDESARQMKDAETVAEAIRHLQEDYEDMRQYYKTLFAVVTEHNTGLAGGIAEVLGEIQFQDVVRQRIERIEVAMAQRNLLLGDLPGCLRASPENLERLAGQMREVLDSYLAEEARHASISDAAGTDDGPPKIELF